MYYKERTKADYQRELQSGQEFEKFVIKLFADRGVDLHLFDTVEQQKHGETVEGVEIKLDRKFRKTGNLFIETEERSTSDSAWHAAGVTKDDNSKVIAIGDKKTIWLLNVRVLRELWKSKVYREVTNDTNTGKGFVLPIDVANKVALNKIEVG